MIEADFTVERENARIHFAMKDKGLILLSGKNGAGKTSSLLCMSGIIMPQSGTFRINGQDIFGIPPGRRRVVYINQNSYFSGMSVMDHFRMVTDSEERIKEVSSMFSIDTEERTDNLSQGNIMRVSVATAILSYPRVLMLDEIISNISEPEAFLEILKKGMNRFSFDVVFVSQNENMADLSDHHYTISAGETERMF